MQNLSLCAYTFGKATYLLRDLQDRNKIHPCHKAEKNPSVIKEALWTVQVSSQFFTNGYFVLSFPSVGVCNKGKMIKR